MNEKLTIPNKIKVGFQNRTDTYTGKLAYVIYFDEKGKLRKETSWEDWRDKEIDAQEFENVPTSGFVLNRGVGGVRASYDWNARNEYVRVYDPRGFEFEISVINLLFILQECSSIKGKGLEGEFVYSWDKTQLVLLPVGTKEHQLSTEFTDLKSKKVKSKEIKEGCLYKDKDCRTLMYLGKHAFWNTRYFIDSKLQVPKEKIHIFVDMNAKTQEQKYITFNNFSKIAEVVEDTCNSAYADLYQEFQDSYHSSVPDSFVEKPFELRDGPYWNISAYQKVSDKQMNVFFFEKRGDDFVIRESYGSYHSNTYQYNIANNGEVFIIQTRKIKGKIISEEEFKKQYFSINLKFKNGAEIPFNF